MKAIPYLGGIVEERVGQELLHNGDLGGELDLQGGGGGGSRMKVLNLGSHANTHTHTQTAASPWGVTIE